MDIIIFTDVTRLDLHNLFVSVDLVNVKTFSNFLVVNLQVHSFNVFTLFKASIYSDSNWTRQERCEFVLLALQRSSIVRTIKDRYF